MKPFFRFARLLVRPALMAAVLLSLFGSMVFVTPARAAAINVTTTLDEYGSGAGCSLREAIRAANTDTAFGGCPAGSGVDTISVPSGVFQLTLANAGGANEDANATGDLDINTSMTIQGSGSGATFIQAGTDNTNGIDKVIAANPTCASGVSVTISGVTVQYGRNTQPISDPNFSFTGGGIDYCAGGSGSAFTLSNSVVSNNTNVNGYGGGLNLDAFLAPNYTATITNVTFQNNRTLSAVNDANGGAINIFGDQVTVNITNSSFISNSTANPTSGGGAIFFRPSATTPGPTSSLTVSGSTFTSNTAAGIGGAIATNTYGAGTTISISNSTFTSNTATNSFGGALYFGSTNTNTTPFSLTHLTITNNTAGLEGGGLYVGSSNVNMSQSLIVGNNAPTAKGLRKSLDATTAMVENNWWGCSTGPNASPCDTASTAGGSLDFTPWYRNQLTATTSPIVTNQSTSLTASFLTNSAGSAVSLANISEIIGRSVAWTATNGALSGTQSTVQAAGTATGSFQATAAGTAVISAKVDNDNTSAGSSNVLSLTVNKANTTAAISNSATLSSVASVTGQPVTVTYTVTGSFGNSPTAPTGNVTVSDGTDSCTASVAAGQCNITFRTAGSKTITATYAGDVNFNASPASSSASHTVNKADATTTITSDTPDPSVTGQTVTFNVTVAAVAPGAAVTPTSITGSVTVSDGGSNSCIAALSAGAGSCTIDFPDVGTHLMTGAYGGDSNFNGSTSTAQSHQVNKADTSTNITSDSPDSSLAGTSVTVNFTVAATSPGAGTPTGNVTVSDGVDSCIGTAASGTCDITLTTFGARTLTATYAGDSNFNGSASSGEPHTVDGYATTTNITSDAPDPSVVGQAVTIQFSVTTGAGVPTGNVTVSDGTISCVATVAAGQCNITFTSTGAKSLTAAYAGDTTHLGSVSASESHQVNAASTTTAITSDTPDPSSASQSVTVNFMVAASAPGSGAPTGNVTVSDGVDSCVGTVATGSCALVLTTGGTRTLTATYAGNSNFSGSVSAGKSHFVDTVSPSVTVNQAAGQANSTSVSPIHFTAVFSEPVIGFANADVTLGGTANPTSTVVTEIAPMNGTTFNVAVSGMNATGTVTASIQANKLTDLVGNDNAASTSTDNTVNYILPQPPLITEGSSVGVTMSEDGSPTPFALTLHASDPNGDPLTWSIFTQPSHGSASAAAGPSTSLAISYTPQNFYSGSDTFVVKVTDGALSDTINVNVTIQPVSPTVTINQAAGQSDPTNSSPIQFTAVFSEPVTGFTGADVHLSGTAGASAAAVTGGPTTYTVKVSGMAGAGTVRASIGANKVQDTTGNSNVASTSTDNLVAYQPDSEAPDTFIYFRPDAITTSQEASFTFGGIDNATFSGDLTFECKMDLDAYGPCTFQKNYSGLAVGTHTFRVRAKDEAGNLDPTPASYTWTIVAAPTVSINNASCASASIPSGMINARIADADGDLLTIRLVANSNPTLVSNTNISVQGVGDERAIFITGTAGKSGTAIIKFEVSDGVTSTPLVVTFKVGTDGDNVIAGTSGVDMLFGMGGSDTINGADGSDLICGGADDDSLNGGLGNDFLNGEAGDDIVNGDAGNDVLRGMDGADALNGGAGRDTLSGENGNDALNGGVGNDILRGAAGADSLTGGDGADFFSGGGAIDTLVDYDPSEGDAKDASSP